MSLPAAEDVRAALEDLRTADRILLSVQGTTQFLRRQQKLDLLGLPTGEGLFGDQTRRDNAHAGDELLAAQHALKQALRRLHIAADDDPETLRQWGRLDGILDHVWTDFLALQRADENHAIAGRVRDRVRALFARVCAEHPEAARGVAPLADDADDVDTRPPTDWLKIGVGIALVVAWALAVVL
jgi:hypothetical protein